MLCTYEEEADVTDIIDISDITAMIDMTGMKDDRYNVWAETADL